MDMFKKEYSCQEGLLVVNCAQIHRWSLAATAARSLSCTLHFKEKVQTVKGTKW